MTDKRYKVEDEVGNGDHTLLDLTVVLHAVVAVMDVTNHHITHQTDVVGAPIVVTTCSTTTTITTTYHHL